MTEVTGDDDERHHEMPQLLSILKKDSGELIGKSRLLHMTLQIVWSVILSNGSPFLLSLGLSKSLTALVWIAAPLCGTVVQPLVGSISDRSQSRWGKRRPFILGGTIGIVVSMLLLAWTERFVQASVSFVGGNLGASMLQPLVILSAIFWIYALNVSIQPVQVGIRALIVENCPVQQQTHASTCASVLTGLGNITGYLFGFTALSKNSTSGTTSFQMLSLFASSSVSASVVLCCLAIHEKHLLPEKCSNVKTRGLLTMLGELYQTYRRLPSKIRKVCYIQFFAWMGWFPFLFYSTTYVGEFYAGQPLPKERSITFVRSSPAPDDKATYPGANPPIFQEAIRYGTFASFLFAVVAFLYNVLLPRLLRIFTPTNPYTTNPAKITPLIIQAWSCSHAFFSILMLATFLVSSQAGATAIVAFAGLSWATTLFAPFAIISTELAAQQALRQDTAASTHASTRMTDADNRTGAVMGLHNVFISAPQILAALGCSAIYAMAKAFGSQEGTAWVLRAGGIAAAAAAWLSCRFNI